MAHDLSGERESWALLLERNAGVVVQALRRPAGAPASPLSALVAARTAAEVIEDVTQALVAEARAAGHTWQEIGGLLRITRQAAQQRFGGDAVEPADAGSAALARRAAEIVEQWRSGDWERLTADWDETMRAQLPTPKLTEAWAQVARGAGALQTVGRPSIVRKGPYRIADVPLVFEHGPMKLRVTFNHDGTVAGLFILLPDAE